ncbi:MAG: UDP-2,3-diacylglucosamine diphosphatase [Bacteroidetes bacterium]|nr:UDP-2,3-diacylglucosamine diphosphatase [Bacteroidota bacterium]MDA1120304.1 UDP-2,3-diacylglucosamine diphosphatase [Bacteroidota bacterium]
MKKRSEEKRKRKVDILVLSDIHLGTYGCRSKELLNYLRSISPKHVILNGDIMDIWQFSKRYWPKTHMKIISQFFKWITNEVQVTYITGNHDEMLRKFEGFKVGSFHIENKLVLNLKNEKVWIFHGDIFDVTMQHSKWLAKFGAYGYDFLILINQVINFISEFFGKRRISLSRKVKDSVKSAVKFANKFELTATEIAAENGYTHVICGHIHKPEIKVYNTRRGIVTYLNSGDWIENLTSLEYNKGKWRIYSYSDQEFTDTIDVLYRAEEFLSDKTPKELFGRMLQEMSLTTSLKNPK